MMIAFWNRREVYVGFDGNDFDRIRIVLAANRIKYIYSFSPNRLYYIYVHKKDADNALLLINKKG